MNDSLLHMPPVISYVIMSVHTKMWPRCCAVHWLYVVLCGLHARLPNASLTITNSNPYAMQSRSLVIRCLFYHVGYLHHIVQLVCSKVSNDSTRFRLGYLKSWEVLQSDS